MKRIGVTGGRDYRGWDDVCAALEAVMTKHGPFVLVQGAATGADALAARWAGLVPLQVDPFPADWDKYGLGAGPLRNQAMVDSGLDGLVAFPGGRGTADMVRRARKAGVPVWFPCSEPTL